MDIQVQRGTCSESNNKRTAQFIVHFEGNTTIISNEASRTDSIIVYK